MTDTPVTAASSPPVARSELVKAFIGDLARPFAIYSTSVAVFLAIVDANTNEGKLSAAGLLLAALFAGKAYEKGSEIRNAAQVEIAKHQAAGPVVAAPVVPAADDGSLPAAERIR